MISNLRDLGGIIAADSRPIRKGMLIRSANLSAAEPEDLKGISAVIDLRTSRERVERPDLVYDVNYLPLSVFEEITAGISHENEASERAIPGMAGLYAYLVRESADYFRKVITAIMEHDFSSGAVLWHCTEGKDRCGITTALILEILGVSRDRIMEDYLKTNIVNIPKAERMREELTVSRGPEYAQSMYQALLADESYLQAAWDAMRPDYISSCLGISKESEDRFRETVLEN